MSVSTQANPCFVSRRVAEQCVEFAREHGLRNFPSDRRTTQRMPFVHPVSYCLDSVPCEAHANLGYVLNISAGGMALYCSEPLAPDIPICIRLPLPNSSNAWISGKILHCQRHGHDYWVGISFLVGDQS